MQQRVNDAANVHDESSEEEKISKYEELNSTFSGGRADENGIFHSDEWWRRKDYYDSQRLSFPEEQTESSQTVNSSEEPEIIDENDWKDEY